MIATPLVFQAQRSNDTRQLNSLSGPNSQAAQANSQDFGVALSDAHPAPARKNPANTPRRDDPGGGQLPQAGNPAPIAAPTATGEAAPARQIANDPGAQTPGAARAAPIASSGDTLPTSAAAPGAPGALVGAAAAAASAAASAAAASAAAAASTAAAAGPDAQPLPSGDQALPGAAALASSGAASTGLSGSAVSAPAAGSAAPASSTAAMAIGSAGALASGDGQAKSGDGTAGQPNSAAAPTTVPTQDTAPVAANTPLDGAGVAPNTDSAAQVVMAAAIAQGSSSPQTNSITDFMATDLGTALARSAAPALTAAAGLADAAATRSVGATLAAVATAATAASIAQLTAAGSATGADKHSHAGGSDSFQPGASNDGAAAAQLLSSANSSVSDSSSAPTLKVSAGVDSAEFGQGVAAGVGVMMDGNLSSAKLQVNPPALGPIEVRIALQAGHAQVWFTSHSAVTRDALESSAPKLREMLGAQGFGQVSVDISQRSFQDRSPQPKGYEALTATRADPATAVDTRSAVSRAASGLLDAYA